MMPRTSVCLLVLLLPVTSAFAASATGPESAACAVPAADAHWDVAMPEAAGFDPAALCAVLDHAVAVDANLHAVLVVRGGRLVAELYRRGSDAPIDVHYGLANPFASEVVFDADALHDVRSISKSVVGLLVGIAAADRAFGALSAPVLEAYPGLADLRTEGRDAITFENLLTMSAGLRWSEWRSGPVTSDETRLLWKSDPVRFVFDRPLETPPGTRFEYNGGATAILADHLERTTGRPLVEYARMELFEPLGITRFVWATDLRDRPMPHAGLRLRPRDMAKVGRLVLDGGRWNGRQIVPEVWIDATIRPHISTGESKPSDFSDDTGYGLQWWTGNVPWHGRELAFAAAVGNGGQRIYVVPTLDLVVVTTAGEYGSPRIGRTLGEIFRGVVAAVIELPSLGSVERDPTP